MDFQKEEKNAQWYLNDALRNQKILLKIVKELKQRQLKEIEKPTAWRHLLYSLRTEKGEYYVQAN